MSSRGDVQRSTWIVRAVHRLNVSFWFLPGCLITFGCILAIFSVWLDHEGASDAVASLGPPFSIGVETARQLLSTLAGATVTVVSLVFSLTVVALTVAAGNLGPRLVDRYMRNRVTQVTMGLFSGTFAFTIMVLSDVGSSSAQGNVPRLSITLALVFALLCVAWLTYAFHNLARSLQIDQASSELAHSLNAGLSEMAKQARAVANGMMSAERAHAAPDGRKVTTDVSTGTGGYVEVIQYLSLVELARREDLRIEMLVAPGDYAGPRDVAMRLHSEGAITETAVVRAAARCLVMNATRTDTDDPLFNLHLLIEVAARALSPGVNDVYTALTCIDHLTGSLRLAFDVGLEPMAFVDSKDGAADAGIVRVQTCSPGADGLVALVLPNLRRIACDNTTAALRVLDGCARIARAVPSGHAGAIILHREIDAFVTQATELARSEADLPALTAAAQAARDALPTN